MKHTLLLLLFGLSCFYLKAQLPSISDFINYTTKDSASILAFFEKSGYHIIESKRDICYDGPRISELPICAKIEMTNDTVIASIAIRQDHHAQSLNLMLKNTDKIHFKNVENDLIKNEYKFKEQFVEKYTEPISNKAHTTITRLYFNILNKDLEISLLYNKGFVYEIYFSNESSFPKK
jgi:hypothetical protein